MANVFKKIFGKQIIKLNIPQDSSADYENHTIELEDRLRAGWNIDHTTIQYQKNGYVERWFLDNVKKSYDESEKRLDDIIEQQKQLYKELKKNKLLIPINDQLDYLIDSKEALESAIIQNKSFNFFMEAYVVKPAKIPVITYHIEKRSILRNIIFYTKKWFYTKYIEWKWRKKNG